MKKQKRKIILIIIANLIICIFLYLNRKNQNEEFQDELIFFKLFSSSEEATENTLIPENQLYQTYSFKVSYKNIDFKDIYLADTINPNTLIREKIAPGTEGTFEILLESNTKKNYQIKFESKNNKPENLNFQIEGKDRKYKRLEDMEQELKGELNENKRIMIHWKWEYEKDSTQDLQDTKDGKIIKQYNFTIYVIGQ